MVVSRGVFAQNLTDSVQGMILYARELCVQVMLTGQKVTNSRQLFSSILLTCSHYSITHSSIIKNVAVTQLVANNAIN